METSRLTKSLWSQRVVPYLRRPAFIMEALSLVAALLLGRVQLLGGLSPLGIAFFVALDMAGIAPVWYPMVGAALGCALCTPPYWAGVAACGGYLGVCACYRAWRGKIRSGDKLLLLGLTQLLLLPVFFSGSLDGWMQGLAGLGLSLLLCGLFSKALCTLRRVRVRRVLTDEEQLCLCLLLGALALGMGDMAIGEFSLSVVAVCLVSLFAAYAKGMQGVAAAVALGGMLVLGGKAQTLFVANLAVCTLAAAVCRSMGTWGVTAAFGICSIVISAYVDGVGRHVGLWNLAPAAALFLLISKPSMLALCAAVDNAARDERRGREAFSHLRRRTAEKLKKTALAVEQVAGLFPQEQAVCYDPQAEGRYMSQAAGHICQDCSNRAACWREPQEAAEALFAMLPSHAKGVRPRPPAPLDPSCRRTSALCAAAAQAQTQYRQWTVQKEKAQAQQAFARRQLKQVGGSLNVLASRVQQDVWQNEALENAIQQELEQAGLKAKTAAVIQRGNEVIVELRLGPRAQKQAQRAVDCASKALGKPLRLLRSREEAKGLYLELELARPLHARMGGATLPAGGRGESGDSMGQRELEGGKFLCVLSDGMGTGKRAGEESRGTVNMLLDLMETGFPRDRALECVNRLRLSSAGEQGDEMYATVDALRLDLETGEGEFIKCGAPPSFVLREGRVHTVYAEALPAGIVEEAVPAVHKAVLRRNDVVVLLTDGALDALGQDTADEIRINVGGANTPQDAAEALLCAARARNDYDDMSVAVVRLE